MQAISPISSRSHPRAPALVCAALMALSLGFAAVPAQADPDGWRGDRDREWRERVPPGWWRHERPVYVAPGYYYAPPPVVYAPPPVVYTPPPPPVIYAPAPAPYINLGVTFR